MEAIGEQLRDDFGEGRWLTYAELAEIRGIGRESAVKLVQREGWRKRPGNNSDRTVRVLVPEDWLKPARQAHIPEGFPEDFAGLSRIVRPLEAAVEALRAQLAAANSRADKADAGREAAEIRADRADQALAGERARAARPLLARLRAAWRGETEPIPRSAA